jgi:hypothetical protein
MKRISLLVAAVLLAIFSFSFVSGATLGVEDEYTLPKEETIRDDLYVGGGVATLSGTVLGDVLVAGGEVTILGRTTGSVFVAGGNILISGDVLGDVMAAGGTVDILGSVGDDVRVAGGNIGISSNVGGDVVVAGGVVHIVSGTFIGGDLISAGGLITVDGTVQGDIRAEGGELRVNGTVQGNINAGLQDGLVIGENAVVSGIVYRSPKEAEISEGATIRGEVSFTESKGKDKSAILGKDFLTAGIATSFLMLVVFGLAAVYFAKDGSYALVKSALSSFWRNVIRGFVVLIVSPVLAFLLLISVIGVPIGFLVGFVYISALLIAKMFTGVVIGALVLKLLSRSEELKVNWITVVLGAALLILIFFVPLIGFTALFIFFLASFGSTVNFFYKKLLVK